MPARWPAIPASPPCTKSGGGTTTRRRGPAPKLQQQVERLARLPKSQQRVVMQMIEGVLAQTGSR